MFNIDETIKNLRTNKVQFKDLSLEERDNSDIALFAIKMDSKNIGYIWDNLVDIAEIFMEIFFEEYRKRTFNNNN